MPFFFRTQDFAKWLVKPAASVPENSHNALPNFLQRTISRLLTQPQLVHRKLALGSSQCM